jgi:hypothetical protein
VVDLIALEVGEDRRERFSPFEHVGRLGTLAVHVDGKAGVDGEQRLLRFSVATVGAVGVGVEELADGETVGGLGRRELGVDGHERKPSERCNVGSLAVIPGAPERKTLTI